MGSVLPMVAPEPGNLLRVSSEADGPGPVASRAPLAARSASPGGSRQPADSTVTSPVAVEAEISLVEAGFVGTSTLVSPVWV